MRRYNTYVLEDIVVQLCLRDSNATGENEAGTGEKVSSAHSLKSSPVLSLRAGTPFSLSSIPLDGPDLISIPDHDEELRKSPAAPRRQSLGQVLHRASNAAAIQKHNFGTEVKEKLDRIYACLTKNILVLVRNFG